MSVYPMLGPSETFLDGKWAFSGAAVVADDISCRIEFLTEKVLLEVATDSSGWRILYKDPGDGRYWELSHTDSGLHGGGAPTLKCLDVETVQREYGVI